MSMRPEYPPEMAPFAGAALKLRRAETHIRDLYDQIIAFLGRDPYRVVEDPYSEPGKHIVRVKITEWPPHDWSALIGDALGNMRAALDHVVYDLTIAHSKNPLAGTALPILTESDLWDETDKRGKPTARSGLHKTRGIHEDARRIIHEIQPFHAGQDARTRPLAMLNELVNIDKHRTLTLCGSAIRSAILYAPPGAERWVTGPGPVIDGQPLAFCALVNDAKPDLRLDVAFDVAFDYRTPYEGTPVVPALRTMAAGVVRVMALLIRFAA